LYVVDSFLLHVVHVWNFDCGLNCFSHLKCNPYRIQGA
jgi:hypothetical protein